MCINQIRYFAIYPFFFLLVMIAIGVLRNKMVDGWSCSLQVFKDVLSSPLNLF